MRKISTLICFAFLFVPAFLSAQSYSDTYAAFARQDYYTDETAAEIMVGIPDSIKDYAMTIDIVHITEFLVRDYPVFAGDLMPVAISLEDFSEGDNEITVSFNLNGSWVSSVKVNLLIRPVKDNAVKRDLASGGLVVDGLPFFPVGFYTTWPVDLSSLNDEVARGFNLISPYWTVDKKSRKERLEFMDRCAELGLKVNFNLCSVAEGTKSAGRQQHAYTYEDRIDLLKDEVEKFRDHPALLAWYISDEPLGQGVSADSLKEAYEIIKSLDPYHPVSIVFMTPNKAGEYQDAMDIAMTDPYPVPGGDVTEVVEYIQALQHMFRYRKSVWVVPQAFGGNEFWAREPSSDEVRVMTWLALVNGASGVQYFIRRPPNGTPKNYAMWGECGAMAMEIGELTPDLMAGQPAPILSTTTPGIYLRALNENGRITIVAVNSLRDPQVVDFKLDHFDYRGGVNVLFEARTIDLRAGKMGDLIDGYGVRFYRIDIRNKPDVVRGLQRYNMTRDPSFENIDLPGVPASCYATVQENNGSAYFTDARVAYHEDHSLRVNTTEEGKGVIFSFYGMDLSPENSYTLSLMAKSKDKAGPAFEMSLYDRMGEFNLKDEWKRYTLENIMVPGSVTGDWKNTSPGLTLTGKGVAWFDLLQVTPDLKLFSTPIGEEKAVLVQIQNQQEGTDIFYTIDGSEPTLASSPFDGTLWIKNSGTFRAAAFKGEVKKGEASREFHMHDAIGKSVKYQKPYETYFAGGDLGLVDGLFGSDYYLDGRWQGFHGDNLHVIIDLGEVIDVESVAMHFLEDQFVWIFRPEDVTVLVSEDGATFEAFASEKYGQPRPNGSREIITFDHGVTEPVKCRYIRIFAQNTGACPFWHKGAGEKAWIFIDEILVNGKP